LDYVHDLPAGLNVDVAGRGKGWDGHVLVFLKAWRPPKQAVDEWVEAFQDEVCLVEK